MQSKREAITRTRALYYELNRFLVEWDPYGLASSGEIGGDFAPEIWDLLGELVNAEEEEETIQAISNALSARFGGDMFGLDACRPIAGRIHAWWCREG